MALRQGVSKLSRVGAVAGPFGPEGPGVHQGGHVLGDPPEEVAGGLHAPARLRPEHKRVLRQVIRPTGEVRVDQVHVPVCRREALQVRQLPAVRLHRVPEGLQPLGVVGPLHGPFHLALFLLNGGAEPQNPPGGQLGQSFRRGEQDGFGDVGGPPLGGRVKDPHGVDLISPEFRPHWSLCRRGVHIQNPTSEGELPRPFHLIAPGVPGGGELIGQGVQAVLSLQLQGEGGPV